MILKAEAVAARLQELREAGTLEPAYLRQCEALCAALDERGSDNRLPFPRALGALYPDAAPTDVMDAFKTWRSRLNGKLREAGASFELAVSQSRRLSLAERLCWFEGEDRTEPKFRQHGEQEARNDAPIEPARGIPIIRYFVSYAHADRRAVESLVNRLDLRLSRIGGFKFVRWRDTEAMVPGENIRDEVEKGIDSCHIGLQMVSHAYLNSEFVREHERPRFAFGDDCKSGSGKRLGFPIALDTFDFETYDLGEFGPNLLFVHEGKGYRYLQGQARDGFADACVRMILEATRRYLAGADGESPSASSNLLTDEMAVHEAASGDLPGEYVSAHGHETRMQRLYPSEPGDSPPETLGVPVLDHLLHWATMRRTTPLFALLGEYGMGKTVNCKQLTVELLDRRKRAEVDGPLPPMPVYLDLRYARGLFRSETPQQGSRRFEHVEVDDLVNAIFREIWKTGEKPDAADLRRLIAGGNVLIVFDGFDEVAVHLHPDEAQSLIRTMWSLLPSDALSPHAERRPAGAAAVQMLISCRTHYFRDLAQQAGLFTGHQRDLERGADLYDAMILLPFTDDQMERFLAANLGDEDKARRALDTIRSVHNLSELAGRPVLLDRICGQLGRIEALAARGETINAARLYDLLIDEWFARDVGKHTFDVEIKKTLMARLAGAMWCSGERVWPAGQVESWLDAELRSDPRLKERYADFYRGKAREILFEDLRTSTFVVRPGEDGFRFAHTSIQEYFLARHLFETLCDGDADAWANIAPSPECLDFLAEIACENAPGSEKRRFFGELGNLLRHPYRPGVSEAALRVALEAQRRGEPAAPRGRYRLEGARLSGWEIVRRDGAAPIDLSGSDFTGATLKRIHFADISARDCVFDGAALEFVCFERVDLSGGSFEQVSALASVLRQCRMSGTRDGGAIWRRSVFIHCADLERTDGNDDGPGESLIIPGVDFAELSDRRAIPKLEVKLGCPMRVEGLAFSLDGTRIVSQAVDDTVCLWDGETGEEIALLSNSTRTHYFGRDHLCAFSPDGKRVASRIGGSGLRLWDSETCEEIAVLGHPIHWLYGWAFSPDGTQLASMAGDGVLRLWDDRTGAAIAQLRDHPNSASVCIYSPDGARIVTGARDNSLRLLQCVSGMTIAVLKGHTGSIGACAFSPDGARFVSGAADTTLRLWHGSTGQPIAVLKGHTDRIRTCAFSPDGARIVSGADDKTVRLWDGESGEELAVLTGHVASVHTVAFSPDGNRIVSGSYDTALRLWDAETGEGTAVLRGQSDSILACAVSPDGSRIVSADQMSALRLWDGKTGDELAVLQSYVHRVPSCAVSRDGRRIVSGSGDSELHMWDGRTGEETAVLRGHTGWVYACAISPDGMRAVSGASDNTLRLWDGEAGEEIAVMRGHSIAVLACAFSPDGERIVSGAGNGTLRLWDGSSGEELVVFRGHACNVVTCAFSPDGRRIVSGSADGELRLWDGYTGGEIAVFEDNQSLIMRPCFSPNGKRIAFGANDTTLHLWDGDTGEEVMVLEGHRTPRPTPTSPDENAERRPGLPNGTTACAFSRDGRYVVSGDECGVLRLWDCENGVELAIFRGHTLTVMDCAFNADGTRILSAGQDHTLRLWDVGTGDEIAVLRGHAGWVTTCDFSPNGAHIVSAASDNTLRLWDAETGKATTVCYHLPDGGHLAFSAPDNRVLSASGNAWRYFRWHAPDREPYPLLPLEADPRIGAIPKDGYRTIGTDLAVRQMQSPEGRTREGMGI